MLSGLAGLVRTYAEDAGMLSTGPVQTAVPG
jgi:hypothetical protein